MGYMHCIVLFLYLFNPTIGTYFSYHIPLPLIYKSLASILYIPHLSRHKGYLEQTSCINISINSAFFLINIKLFVSFQMAAITSELIKLIDCIDDVTLHFKL